MNNRKGPEGAYDSSKAGGKGVSGSQSALIRLLGSFTRGGGKDRSDTDWGQKSDL